MRRARPQSPRLTRARNLATARVFLLPDLRAEEEYRQGLTGILESFEEEGLDEDQGAEEAKRRVSILWWHLFAAQVNHNAQAARVALQNMPGVDMALHAIGLLSANENTELVVNVVRLVARGELSLAAAQARMDLIASDQSHKANVAINRARFQAAGASHFWWLTMRDDRVRPKHARKDGHVFPYADPPADTGPPGHEPGCRCLDVGILP